VARSWNLLDNFARFVARVSPELVTMENVPELAKRGHEVFSGFLKTLERHGYSVDWRIVNCADYGAPQNRKRLVLLASRLGDIAVPGGKHVGTKPRKTVREAIDHLPRLAAGQRDQG